MSAVFASKVARRRAIAFIALLAASLVLMAVSGSRVVVDLQHGLGFAFRPMQSALDGLGRNLASIGSARAENERIRIENRQAEELRRENEQLTGLLQLRSGFEYETIAASVIARDSSEVQRRITLDRWTVDGIEVGDVVIAGGGALVGRVVDAGATSATVQLISDSGSTVIGQLLTSAATGEVTGQLPDDLRMENIAAAVTVTLGEEVVTAGIELAGGVRSPHPKGP